MNELEPFTTFTFSANDYLKGTASSWNLSSAHAERCQMEEESFHETIKSESKSDVASEEDNYSSEFESYDSEGEDDKTKACSDYRKIEPGDSKTGPFGIQKPANLTKTNVAHKKASGEKLSEINMASKKNKRSSSHFSINKFLRVSNARMKKLQCQLQELEKKQKCLKDENKNLRHLQVRFEKELVAQEKSTTDLSKTLKSNSDEVANLTKLIKKYEEENRAKEKKIDLKKKEIADLQKEQTNIKDLLKNKGLNEEIKLKNKIGTLHTQLEEKKNALKEKKSQLDAMKKKNQQELEREESSHKDANHKLVILLSDCKSIQALIWQKEEATQIALAQSQNKSADKLDPLGFSGSENVKKEQRGEETMVTSSKVLSSVNLINEDIQMKDQALDQSLTLFGNVEFSNLEVKTDHASDSDIPSLSSSELKPSQQSDSPSSKSSLQNHKLPTGHSRRISSGHQVPALGSNIPVLKKTGNISQPDHLNEQIE